MRTPNFTHVLLRALVLSPPFAKQQCVWAPKVAKLRLLGWITLQHGPAFMAWPRYTSALVSIEDKDTDTQYKGVLYHQVVHIIPWHNNASIFIMKTNWFGPMSVLFAINCVSFWWNSANFSCSLCSNQTLKADFHKLSVIRQWGLCKCGLIWAAVCSFFFCRGKLSLKNWEDEWVVPWAVFLLIWPSFTLDTTKEFALVDGAHNSFVLMKAAWQLHKSLLDTSNRLLHTNL